MPWCVHSHDDTKNDFQSTFWRFFCCSYNFVCNFSLSASLRNTLNSVVWHVCRANEGYSTHRTHGTTHWKVPMSRHRNTHKHNRSENRKKANIPIGIKVCTIYLNPWSGWKLFCIADVVIRLSEHCRSKPKAIRVVAARAYTREEKNKKKRTEFMYTCYYGGISFNLIWVIRIFGVSIINICLSQLLTHLIRLS